MSEKNRLTAPLLRHFRKERITRLPRGGFDRHLSVVSDRADIRGPYFKIDIVFRGEFFDKARIGLGREGPRHHGNCRLRAFRFERDYFHLAVWYATQSTAD